MTEPSKMRRHVVAALSITAILTIVPASASQAEVIGHHYQVPATICSFDWQKGVWQVKGTDPMCRASLGGAGRSAARRCPSPTANRSSHRTPTTLPGCAGIYQHMLKYWPGRADAFGFPGWSAFNARANIIVTMEMVRRAGWGPWAG